MINWPEKPVTAFISTAHLTDSDQSLLRSMCNNADRLRAYFDPPAKIDATRYGYRFVVVQTETSDEFNSMLEAEGLSETTRNILEQAIADPELYWLEFDAAGPIVPNLPTFDW